MSLPLPVLDDRTFDDLVEDARALIPTYDPEWTDHNLSDLGITLIELFAWLAEMLIFRSDQVPARHTAAFLALLNGPGWESTGDLDADVTRTVRELRQRHVAVTGEDWEALAREWSTDVARARCLPRRRLTAGTEDERERDEPGHLSLVVVPRRELEPRALPALLDNLWRHLDARRVLTTRHHVVGPFYVPVMPDVVVARREDVPEGDVRRDVARELEAFLDPLGGGPAGDGWPFGRSVYVSELYERLEAVPGVDHVPDVFLSTGGESELAATLLRHDEGDLVGLALRPHHLPRTAVDPSMIAVGTSFLPVTVNVEAAPATPELKSAAKDAVRDYFHPRNWPPPGLPSTPPWRVDAWRVASAVEERVGELGAVSRVWFGADAARLSPGADPSPVIEIRAGELAEVQAEVVSPSDSAAAGGGI